MSLVIAATIHMAVAMLGVEADALPYYDPPSAWVPFYSYAFKGAGSILREKGERLLLIDAGSPAYPADHVIALVGKDYDSVRGEFRELMRNQWGILEEHDNETGPIPQSPADIVRDDLAWPMLGEELMRLGECNPPQKAREYELVSQPYNQMPSINGRSQSVVRVSDGADIVGKNVTILQLTRSDWSREWARSSWHGIFPLPYKEERRSQGVVTSSEIALIESLKKRFPGIVIRYFVQHGLQYDSARAKAFGIQLEKASRQIEK